MDERGAKHLEGVHPDLVKLVGLASRISEIPFTITEGVRSLEQQKRNVTLGASQTLRSRHLDGHAVDVAALVDGKINWSWPLYKKIADAFKQASDELKIPVEWGGDWKTFKDGPHFQLPWRSYPSTKGVP